jgi:hypothetical protein
LGHDRLLPALAAAPFVAQTTSQLIPWPQQRLNSDVCDPAWLAVIHRDGLEAPPDQQQLVEGLCLVQSLSPADIQGFPVLPGFAGFKVFHTLHVEDAVGIHFIVDLQVRT